MSTMNARIGIAKSVADVSGWAMAQDLGAISPTTTWRKVAMMSASAKPATSVRSAARPHDSKSGVSQWCTAGLVMAPSARVQIVIPS